MIYTIVLHHPARDTVCLARTLDSLETVTEKDHVVDVIVQGQRNSLGSYPRKGDGYKLKYADVGKNLGIGGGFKLGVERFLKSDAQWLAKIDDDIIAPAHAWDILHQIHLIENEKNECLLGGVMMATGKTRRRLLKKGVSSNGVKLIYPADGTHWHGTKEMYGQRVKWSITDFADIGCTLYPRCFFEKSCIPDEKLFIGGIGLDLVMQGQERGYKSAVCYEPKNKHLNKDCHSTDYAQVRKNKKTFRNSCIHFHEKWGVTPLPLAQVAGMVRPKRLVAL